jgi:hypothetical protein
MSLRDKSDVHNHLGASRKHYSLLTMTPASEADATGNSSADDYAMVEKDELTEASAILVEKSKIALTLPQTSKEGA